ncbi:hypothetical protein L7F22_028601 [Adiantum nelumboides]|nr:hypothetical protein [Adiantum nelumboides]MCO5574808.1 hypothetical protein [Adiantum nelumboides]
MEAAKGQKLLTLEVKEKEQDFHHLDLGGKQKAGFAGQRKSSGGKQGAEFARRRYEYSGAATPSALQEDMSTREPQLHRPVIYGDIFLVQGDLAKQAITPQDAAVMQSAETLALGRTVKGGVATTMQSAAAENVKTGTVKEDTHNMLADEGVTIAKTILPSAIVHIEFITGQPILSSVTPLPMVPAIATL